MTAYQIPVQPLMSQSFTVGFIGGIQIWFRIYWVDAPEAGWTMDVGKNDVEPLVCGIPMLPGRNLLDDYPELHFPLIVYISTPGDQKAAPRFEDLGKITSLFFELITA